MAPSVQGCHLVGSVPFADTATVFRKCLSHLPNRLKRIPDGETGSRQGFTSFQAGCFSAYPAMLTEFRNNAPINNKPFTSAEIDEGLAAVTAGAGIQTHYDDHAIASYAEFTKLRDAGVIPAGVKFQVCLPTISNVIMPFVQKAFLPRLEPLYEQALLAAMRNIQAQIPHQDLSIQIDIAGDTAYWEVANGVQDEHSGLSWFPIWWEGDLKQYTLNHVLRMIEVVEPDVELGLHNCYGDMAHKHWYEPTSLGVVAERGLRIMTAARHPINYFHCPVPKSAHARPEVGLESYIEPLRQLLPHFKQHHTELYLGVVHEGREDLTREMIAVAIKVLGGDGESDLQVFGVAQECGGGRMNEADFVDCLEIAAKVSGPSLGDARTQDLEGDEKRVDEKVSNE